MSKEAKATRGKTTPPKENAPIPAAPPPGSIVVYYDRSKGAFYTKGKDNTYQRTERDLLSLELRCRGFHRKAANDYELSPLEMEMLRISKHQGVDYAGEIGGYKTGLHEVFGSKLLVTRGPCPVVPVEGKFPNIADYIDSLLGDQKQYFFGWAKWALVSLRKGAPWPPGQAFAIAGPVGCGKSMLQSLITPMLGNRTSKPYKYLIGKTDFNGDIFAAEHGIVGDEVPMLDIRSRRNFGSALKNLIVNKEQAVRGMYKEAVTLTPFVRLSISLNDDPESLLCLPPLDSDVKDKLIIVHARKVDFPWPSKEFPDSRAFFAKLLEELPAFVHWLLRWTVPASIRDQRYGVKSYHNPDLVGSVDALAPEYRLWEMIVHRLGADSVPVDFVGTSLEIERKLKEDDRTGEVKGLLAWSTACGQYLAKLANKIPDRVKVEKMLGRSSKYTLHIPAKGKPSF